MSSIISLLWIIQRIQTSTPIVKDGHPRIILKDLKEVRGVGRAPPATYNIMKTTPKKPSTQPLTQVKIWLEPSWMSQLLAQARPWQRNRRVLSDDVLVQASSGRFLPADRAYTTTRKYTCWTDTSSLYLTSYHVLARQACSCELVESIFRLPEQHTSTRDTGRRWIMATGACLHLLIVLLWSHGYKG